MSNESQFLNLCQGMANLEDAIKSLEAVGLNPEPDEGIGLDIYNACSIMYRVAAEYLDFPDVVTENVVFDALMQANKENVDQVSREVWSKYGIK